MCPPRFRLRSLLIAVAVAAVAFGLAERSRRFRRLAVYHEVRVKWRGATSMGLTAWKDGRGQLVTEQRSDWHDAMRTKYQRAAERPWLPVAPDPPPHPPPPVGPAPPSTPTEELPPGVLSLMRSSGFLGQPPMPDPPPLPPP
jgi:hypothetical protein